MVFLKLNGKKYLKFVNYKIIEALYSTDFLININFVY